MKLQNLIILFFALFILGCGNPTDKHGHEEENEAAHEGEDAHDHEAEEEYDKEKEVHMVAEQMEIMAIKTGGFKNMSLNGSVKASGELELPPQKKASVSTLTAGRVKKIHVLEGDKVVRGQILTELESPTIIKWQQEYMEAEGELGYLKEQFDRVTELFENETVSKRDFQQAKSEFNRVNAKSVGFKAQLQMIGIDPEKVKSGQIQSSFYVRSPLSGYVRVIQFNLGQYVTAETELFEIVDNHHIHIGLNVFEKDLAKISNNQRVNFTLVGFPNQVFEGKIFAVGKAFETQTRSVKIHAEIENKTGKLLPGMYVDARIIVENKNTLCLPEEAVVEDEGLSYIFLEKSANQKTGEVAFEKIEVNTGLKDIGYIEILPVTKIHPKSQIVVSGAFYLLAEMKKGEGGHGHHH
jgi:cobalt-zinc-cadmium efflux system membrane fusion protein